MSILPASDNAFAPDVAAVSKIDAVGRILETICRTTGMGFAAVARVTESRWVALAVRDEIQFGLTPGGELRLDSTICNEIRSAGEPVAIDHVALDECFRDHPTPKLYGFQSYVSVPIRLPDDGFFGTLCAIDPRPARVKTPAVLETFRLFADLIGMHLDAQRRIAASEAALVEREAALAESRSALVDAREAAQLHEQFIAVLGHDLRNPIAAVSTGVEILSRQPQSERGQAVLTMMRGSVRRMVGLVDDVLDFARGRLGGGLAVRVRPSPELEASLRHAIAELQSASPGRTIRAEFSIGRVVVCDAPRVAQTLSNLLANALAHGDPSGEVYVRAATIDGSFTLSVENGGATIPEPVLARLFRPFVRGEATAGKQGLGLGLYIAAEIARAHGGTLAATSAQGHTRFTLTLPVDG